MSGYFISGTDTEIGKTLVTLGLMRALKNSGARVGGMKPVASGCIRTEQGLRNDDALQIMLMSDLDCAYDLVNPYAFEAPVAPHVLAHDAGVTIELARIKQCYEQLAKSADTLVVEGVGGWRVPLGQKQAVPDLVLALDLPVIMVVGLKLGCINHAMLTAAAIKSDGLQLLAWVANELQPDYEKPEATLGYLNDNLETPLLGHIPFMQETNPEKTAAHLDLKKLSHPDRFTY